MNKKLSDQIDEIKIWAFPVAGMAFTCFIPIMGLIFSFSGLIQTLVLYRQSRSESRNLLIFAIIGTTLSLFITAATVILTYQEFLNSSFDSSSSIISI